MLARKPQALETLKSALAGKGRENYSYVSRFAFKGMIKMQQINIRSISLSVIFSLFIGLSTYGQQWRAFTTADGLAGTMILSMLEDQNGNLWFGTGGGLSQFNGFFTTHLSGKKIQSYLESSNGKIWAGTMESGLHSYDGATWQEHLSDRGIDSLLEDKEGKIWAGTVESGLHSYDGQTWREHLSGMSIDSLLEGTDGKIWAGAVLYDNGNILDSGLYNSYDGTTWQEYLGGMLIRVLLESSDGNIWAGTWDDGLWMYDGTTWQEHLSGMRIRALLESSDGRIWAGAVLYDNGNILDSGLYNSYDGTTWQKHLGGMQIHALLESSDDNIWAGTFKKGLHSYDGTTWREHLSGMTIRRSLIEDKDGKIWAGTWGDGLWMYDGTTWQERQRGMRIDSLLEDKDGKIWAGIGDNGLYCYDGTTWQEHLSEMTIISLLESQDEKIWAGTVGNGLYNSYDGTTWQEHLNEMTIYALLESSDGNIWAGAVFYENRNILSGGLYCYDGITWQEHLSGMTIISLLESQDEKIWAGTWDDSLWMYDGTTWQEHLSEKRGKRINALLESSDGNIWAGTNGLYCYDGTTWQEHLSRMSIISLLESQDEKIWAGTSGNGVQIYNGIMWQAFTALDGLPGNTIWSILEDSGGRLWFGTSDGIGVYKPNDNPPLIDITNPEEKTVEIGKSSLFIEWRAGDIETETNRLIYQYKINDDSWSYPIQLLFTTLTELDDGENIFYVRATDRDFNYSKPATITIIIDTIQPNVLIGSPTQGAIVGGIVKVMGGVTDSDLDEFRVEYAVGEVPSDGDFKLIRSSSREIESGQLAKWEAKSLDETQYTIRVHASDKLGHAREDTVTVTLDNTPPVAKLIAPQDGSRLTKQTEIIGEVSDEHLDGYVWEYTTDTDLNKARWEQIFQKIELLQTQQTEVQINKLWEVPTITGTIAIRLTAIDAAGNTDQQMVSVEVPKALIKDKGGATSSSDGNAQIYIPPRSLPSDTIITINSVPEQEWEGEAPAELSWKAAYDFEPFDLKFNQKPYKPATITLKYPAHLPESGKTLAIYRFQKEEAKVSPSPILSHQGRGEYAITVMWVSSERLGGTIDSSNKTITSATKRLGRFVVMQEPEPTLGEYAKITQLTCQPRIFSPKGGGFDTRTAISFNLTKSACVTIKIYNRAGKLKRLMEENKEMPEGVNVIFWDGRDDEEDIVKSNLYIVTVTVGDATVIKTVAISNR